MGLTAKTTGGNKEGEISGIRVRIKTFGLDASYTTGGYPVTGPFFGMGALHGIVLLGWNTAGQGYEIQYNSQTKKLMVFRVGTGTVIGNVTVVGGTLGEATGINPDSNAGVLSKAAATNRTIPIATYLGAAPTIAAGALAEVANGVDLSALVLTCMAIGY